MNGRPTSPVTILGSYGAIYLLVVVNLVLALAGISGTWAVVLAVGIASLQAIVVALVVLVAGIVAWGRRRAHR